MSCGLRVGWQIQVGVFGWCWEFGNCKKWTEKVFKKRGEKSLIPEADGEMLEEVSENEEELKG
ncbi:unnamed protein product [Wuchereria bancrofti]|nr:unnamed protein product [Wuchereria bancrofti]